MSSLHRARPPFSHIHVCDERVLASPKAGNIGDLFDESFSIVPQVTVMCKSASYHLRKNSFIRKQFSTLMQPSFLIKQLSHQTLATINCYYLVYLSTLLNSYNVCRTQLLVLLLFRPSSVIFHPFLRIFTGSRLIFGLNLKYLSLPRRLSMDWLLLMFKIFLQSYLPTKDLRSSKKNLLSVPAFNINSYGRRAFSVAAPLLWNSLSQQIRDAGSLDIFERQLKTVLYRRAFLNWWHDSGVLYLKLC